MDFISMIFLAIVLVAQITLFVLFFLEKRYVNHRFSAMLRYIDRKVEDADCKEEVEGSIKELLDAFSEDIDDRLKKRDEVNNGRIELCVSEQVKALALDFGEAQAAANKINDFASNLSAIFDYDPMEALKKGRSKEAG